MDYPKRIYKKYHVIEKEIHGEVFYGVVRTFNIFGFKFKKRMPVQQNPYHEDLGRMGFFEGSRWVDSKSCVERAIAHKHRESERKFRKEVTR